MAAKLICTKWEHGELLPKLTPKNQSKLKFIYMGDVDSGDKSVITCLGGEHPAESQSACMLFLYPGYKNGTWDSDSEYILPKEACETLCFCKTTLKVFVRKNKNLIVGVQNTAWNPVTIMLSGQLGDKFII